VSEWWLMGGQAVFADGDIGDRNHEAVAWDYLYSEFVEACNAADEPIDLLGEMLPEDGDGFDPTALRTAVQQWADMMQKEGKISEEVADDPFPFLSRELGWDEAKLDEVMDSGTSDIRLYAAREWGWVQLKDFDLTAYKLNRSVLKNVADSLWDAHGDSFSSQTYSVYEYSTGRWFREVPGRVFEAGSMAALRHYADCEEEKRVSR